MARDMVHYRNGHRCYWKLTVFLGGFALRCIGIFGIKGESISMGAFQSHYRAEMKRSRFR